MKADCNADRKKSYAKQFGSSGPALNFRFFLESPDQFEDPDRTFLMAARTLKNFEHILESEIKNIGGSDIETGKGIVFFRGSLHTLYKANYESRTAVSVLIPVAEFTVFSEKDLYEHSLKIPWEKWIRSDYTFAVSSDIFSGAIHHSKFASQRVKDAIADRFREKTGSRPSVNLTNPDVRIRLFVKDNCGTIYIDSSGEPLSRRGYRTLSGDAPLSEVLAAGMILMTGYDGSGPFADPMCGSGTLPIEAAWIAGYIPPGFLREDYGFFRIPHFNQKLWDIVKKDAISRIRYNKTSMNNDSSYFFSKSAKSPIRILGSDSDAVVLQVAKGNAQRAMVADIIDWVNEDFFNLIPPSVLSGERGIGICNPPYGERMVLADPEHFYKSLGDRLKNFWQNYDFWIITADREALKKTGLRADHKTDLMNASIECRYQRFQIYKGSREKE